MTVHHNASDFEGIVQGHVTLTVESPAKVIIKKIMFESNGNVCIFFRIRKVYLNEVI